MKSKKYYVYILTNKEKTVLYTGVTNDLEQRVMEHYTGKESKRNEEVQVLLLLFALLRRLRLHQ